MLRIGVIGYRGWHPVTKSDMILCYLCRIRHNIIFFKRGGYPLPSLYLLSNTLPPVATGEYKALYLQTSSSVYIQLRHIRIWMRH
jgi:hypothetical protein